MNHRRSVDKCKRCLNLGFVNALGQVRRRPVFWSGGIRHRGGVTIFQALVRNLGICRFDVKGGPQVENPQEAEYQCETQRRSYA